MSNSRGLGTKTKSIEDQENQSAEEQDSADSSVQIGTTDHGRGRVRRRRSYRKANQQQGGGLRPIQPPKRRPPPITIPLSDNKNNEGKKSSSDEETPVLDAAYASSPHNNLKTPRPKQGRLRRRNVSPEKIVSPRPGVRTPSQMTRMSRQMTGEQSLRRNLSRQESNSSPISRQGSTPPTDRRYSILSHISSDLAQFDRVPTPKAQKIITHILERYKPTIVERKIDTEFLNYLKQNLPQYPSIDFKETMDTIFNLQFNKLIGTAKTFTTLYVFMQFLSEVIKCNSQYIKTHPDKIGLAQSQVNYLFRLQKQLSQHHFQSYDFVNLEKLFKIPEEKNYD